MTTPPAEAGGFSGNGCHRIRWRLTAPSGPVACSLRERAVEDYFGSIDVSIVSVPASNTAEPRAAPGAAIDCAALRAPAGCVRRINFDELPTSLFRFVGEHQDELPPCLVGPPLTAGRIKTVLVRAKHEHRFALPPDRKEVKARGSTSSAAWQPIRLPGGPLDRF